MDKARVVVMAAKMVRGKEKRMKAGAKVISIIWAIIFRGGVVRNRDASTYDSTKYLPRSGLVSD